MLFVFALLIKGKEVVFELLFVLSPWKRRPQRERLFDALRLIIALIVHNIYVCCPFRAHQQIDLILLLVVESRFLQIAPRLVVVERLILRNLFKLGMALALVCIFEEAVCQMLVIIFVWSFFGLFIQLWIGCDRFVVDDLVSVHFENFNSLHLVFFNFSLFQLLFFGHPEKTWNWSTMEAGNAIVPGGRDAIDTLLLLKVFERCIGCQIFLLQVDHLLSLRTWSLPVRRCRSQLLDRRNQIDRALLFLLGLYFLISLLALPTFITLSRPPIYQCIVVWFIRLFLKRWFVRDLLQPRVHFLLDCLTSPWRFVNNVFEWISRSSWSFSRF